MCASGCVHSSLRNNSLVKMSLSLEGMDSAQRQFLLSLFEQCGGDQDKVIELLLSKTNELKEMKDKLTGQQPTTSVTISEAEAAQKVIKFRLSWARTREEPPFVEHVLPLNMVVQQAMHSLFTQLCRNGDGAWDHLWNIMGPQVVIVFIYLDSLFFHPIFKHFFLCIFLFSLVSLHLSLSLSSSLSLYIYIYMLFICHDFLVHVHPLNINVSMYEYNIYTSDTHMDYPNNP